MAKKKSEKVGSVKHSVGCSARTCSKCGGIFSKDQMVKDRRRPEGLGPWCKGCRKLADRAWRINNPEKDKARCKRYCENNRANVRAIHRRYDAKRYADPRYRQRKCLMWAIRAALKGKRHAQSVWEVLGFSRKELKRRLESQFADGMSWDNMAAWQIDHIIPLSFFQFSTPKDVEFKLCWHLNNLRPVWNSGNASKGSDLSMAYELRPFLGHKVV